MTVSVDRGIPSAGSGWGLDRRDLLCGLWLALLPFLLFWQIAVGRHVFADGDLFTFNYPILHVVAEQWGQGRIPLWNPYIFGGTPLLAAIQGGVFYPPNVVLLLVRPFWLAYGHSILLHYSLCGIFMFLYLRSLDLSRAGAVVGALVYMFGGFTMAHLGHVGMLRTIPWLPLLLFSFEVWRRQGSARHLVLGTIALALMLLAGHPQVPFYSLVIMTSYALFFAATAFPRERRRALAGLAVILAAGGAMAGVQLLPTAFALRDEYIRDGGGTYEYFTMFSFPPTQLISLLFPSLVGVHVVEMSGYVGIAPLALAVVGGLAGHGPQGRHRRYFVVLAAVSLFLVLGSYNPFYPLLHHVPLYNSFRIPSRNWFEFTLAVAVLAALGLDSLRHGSERARRCLGWALVGIGLTAIGAVAFSAVAVGNVGGPAVASRLPVLAATLLLLGSAVIRHRTVRHPAFGVALAVLVAGDLFSFGGAIQGRYPHRAYSRPADVLGFLERQGGPFRTLTLGAPRLIDDFKESLAPDYNAAVGVESLGGYDILMLRHIGPASAGVVGPGGVIVNARLLRWRRVRWFMDLMNTRYVLVSRGLEGMDLDPTRYREVFRNDDVVIHENQRAFPRFFWVPQVRPADRVDALRALKSGRFDDEAFQPESSALVEVPPGVPAPDPALAVPLEASGQGYRPDLELLHVKAGDARVRVDSRVAGLLIHGTNMSSGWTATIDGAPAPVYRTNGFLQGVVVPAGSHVVRLRYWPVSFTLGAVTSLAGLAFVGCVLAWPSLLRGAGSREP